MLDDLNELKTLQQVLQRGSLTAAAEALGLSVAVVSKRLSALERRAGVRLVNRTTRNLSATEEGERLLVEIERALESIRQGEDMLMTGRSEPLGTLRVSAPISFGRRHVAPVLADLAQRHPRLDIQLSLDDRLVDVSGGAIDIAIRIGGDLIDSNAAMRKLVDNVRIAVAAPAYLDRRGRPQVPADLTAHDLLRYGDAVTPWRFQHAHGDMQSVPALARMRVNNGDAMHDWCLAGHGIMLKSLVDTGADLAAGLLERVLPDWHAGERPVVALFPARASMPRKTRVFLDAMVAALATQCP